MRFPAHMKVDYVRVYQEEGLENVTCDRELLCVSLKDFQVYSVLDADSSGCIALHSSGLPHSGV